MNKIFLLLVITIIGIYTPAYAQGCCSSLTPVMSTTTSGQTVTVYNNSTVPTGSGLRVDYLVNWGNGVCWGSSTKTPMTYTYPCAGDYTVKLEVSVFDSSINMMCCLKTTSQKVYLTGPSHLDCSKLEAAMSVTVSGDKAILVDNSMPKPWCNQRASSGKWWGTSNGSYQPVGGTHTFTYKASGTYNIRLIYELKDHIQTCRDTVDTTVSVTVIQPNLMTGNVVTDKNTLQPNDTVKVWLLKYNATTKLYAAVDSIAEPASSNGFNKINFQNKPSGDYVLKAEMLNRSSGRNNIPTYSTDRLYWTYPAVHNHTGGTINNFSVVMRQGKVTKGPGNISGKIKQDGTQNGVEGINVLLLDLVNMPIAYDVTDAEGNYYFSDLPEGTYTVHPEELHYSTTADGLKITTLQQLLSNVDFQRFTADKVIIPMSVGIADMVGDKLPYSIYPNPAKGMVTVNWMQASDDNADIVISDVSGKKVLTTTVKMNRSSVLDVSTLQSGFYMMNVSSEKGSNTQKLIIQ